jgi:hypothetical protein
MKRFGIFLILLTIVSFSCDDNDQPTTIPVPDEESMMIRVKFEPIIGGVLYDNVDAEFNIVGYDAAGVEKWRTTLSYAGPEANDLRIKSGLHRYTMEVKKFGTISQQQFLGTYLWESRVREGAVPVTFVFAGEADARKLDYTISYLQPIGSLVPQTKTTYRYDNGDRLESITTFRYTPATKQYVKDAESFLEYTQNRVVRIETYSIQSALPYETIAYTYDDVNRPARINVKSTRSGISTDVTLTYGESNPTVSVAYQSSNGRGFEYSFVTKHKTIESDQTMRGSQLCSEGRYGYDRSINPLSQLGFVDYLFRNYSAYNRTTEDVIYSGCAFPTLLPESYAYTYDVDGYPLTSRTSYKSKTTFTELHFFYRNN